MKGKTLRGRLFPFNACYYLEMWMILRRDYHTYGDAMVIASYNAIYRRLSLR